MNKPCHAVWQVAGMGITRVFSLFVQWLAASAPAVILVDGAKRHAVFYIAISAIRWVVFLTVICAYTAHLMASVIISICWNKVIDTDACYTV